MLNSIEATQIVDGLCEKLQETDFEGCENEDQLLRDIAGMVEEYVGSELGDLASVWVRGRDRGKIKSVWAYGTDFSPDIAVEVGELPAIAIDVKMAMRASGAAGPVATAIGKALICSSQYPYVIAFILDKSSGQLHKHWFDAEIETRLWDGHRTSLIVSQ